MFHYFPHMRKTSCMLYVHYQKWLVNAYLHIEKQELIIYNFSLIPSLAGQQAFVHYEHHLHDINVCLQCLFSTV